MLWLKISTYSLTVVIGMRLASPAMQNDPRVKDFEARVTQYLNLRKKEAGSSPGATKSPDKLSDNQEQLAARVKALRPDAKQGDIFTPEIAEYFRRQLSSTLAGPDGTKIRASLRHAEPVRGLSLRVNEVYPQGIPLQSTATFDESKTQGRREDLGDAHVRGLRWEVIALATAGERSPGSLS